MSLTASWERSVTAATTPTAPAADDVLSADVEYSVGEELVSLGWEICAHQYRAVQLAARFDEEREWYWWGCRSASQWISHRLQIQPSTAREWIRVGHALRYLPRIDEAFRSGDISYAKARVLTRWADVDNEDRLLALATQRSASRLSTAIAAVLAEEGESDEERDRRLHEERSFTTWTDGDGMTVIRVVLPPSVAKPIVGAVDQLVRQIAATPVKPSGDAPAGASDQPTVAAPNTESDEPAPAGASDKPTVTSCSRDVTTLRTTLEEMRQRWQPAEDDWFFPTLGQQRADAFTALFLGRPVEVATEVVVHVRGDGTTFDDGTPTTNHAVLRQLDEAFIRLMIHDADRRPVNASSRRRHPTTRQKRVVMEAHRHECVDCQTTDLLELDHNPPYHQTRQTVTEELEPRCPPCHRARHRNDPTRRSRESNITSGNLPPEAGSTHGMSTV